MAAYGRRALRDLFDDSPTPHIAHPPRTHHRDYYVATDGSFYDPDAGGLGVLIETRDGDTITRLSVHDDAPDNNVAEYRALHLGLDVLAELASTGASVGVLIDHNDLAANVNRAALAATGPDWRPPHPFELPPLTENHWRGIRARVTGFTELRAARIASEDNPAHPLANAPDRYSHLSGEHDRAVLPAAPANRERDQVPPPSRADRDRAAGD